MHGLSNGDEIVGSQISHHSYGMFQLSLRGPLRDKSGHMFPPGPTPDSKDRMEDYRKLGINRL